MTMRSKKWILIADGSKASIYERPSAAEPISAIHHMSSADARLQDRELVSDRQGRNTGNPTTGDGVGGRHGFDPSTEPNRHEEHEFARAVADYLDDMLAKNRFHGIAVVAAPNMLGDLRELMSEGLRAAVTTEIPKDLTQLDEFALEKHLRQHEGI